MSGRLVFLTFFGTFFIASLSRADTTHDSRVLHLDDVLASVMRSFPLLKAAELESAIASAEFLSAEGGFDVAWKTRGSVTPVGYYNAYRIESVLEQPTPLWGVSTFAGWRLGRGEYPTYDGRQETLKYGEIRAGVNVPLWRDGPIDRRRANLARASLTKDVAKLTVDEQRILISRTATHRYWAWVAAGRRLHIAETLLRNVKDRDAGLQARVERGDLPPVERTDNARAIEQRQAQTVMALRALEQAAIELGLFLRDKKGQPLLPSRERLPTRFPEPLPDGGVASRDDFKVAASQRPEAKRLQLQLRQSEVELRWAKNQRAPGIDLQLVGSRDIGPRSTERPDLSEPVLEATLLLDIPLQTRVMKGRADAASATRTRLRYQQEFAKERIQADVRDAQSGIARARERIEAARREAKLAVELERAERIRFEQGDSHLLIVNIREQQTAEAELRVVDAFVDYYRSLADLQAARGEYLSSSK